MRLLQLKLYIFMCFFSCASSKNEFLARNKNSQAIEVQVENRRAESYPRIGKQASDSIQAKYTFSVTHEPENYEARFHEEVQSPREFLGDSIPAKDVSAILEGYALFVKLEEPFEESSKFATYGVLELSQVEQEDTHDHHEDITPDDHYKPGLDTFADYEIRKGSKPFLKYNNPKVYNWHDHHHLSDGDNYKHHNDSYLHENQVGKVETRNAKKGDERESEYDFNTTYHKGFHGHYDNEHHSDYYDGHDNHDSGHHDAEFVLGDYNQAGNYDSDEYLGKDKGHKSEREVDGFLNVFHNDEFKKVRDSYNSEDLDGYFYKKGEHKHRFDDSKGKLKIGSDKDSKGKIDYFERSGTEIKSHNHLDLKGDDDKQSHEKYHNEKKCYEKKRGHAHKNNSMRRY